MCLWTLKKGAEAFYQIHDNFYLLSSNLGRKPDEASCMDGRERERVFVCIACPGRVQLQSVFVN